MLRKPLDKSCDEALTWDSMRPSREPFTNLRLSRNMMLISPPM